jgi:hypothetical protein
MGVDGRIIKLLKKYGRDRIRFEPVAGFSEHDRDSM